MNYYYDIKLNFHEELINFYEWDNEDNIELFKKIPLILISNKAYEDIYNYNIIIKDPSFFNKSILFTSKNGVIALLFDESGKVEKRSSLDIIDEVNILDILYTLTNKRIDYLKLNKIKINSNLRDTLKIKKIIKEEITNLIKNKDYDKLKYLYIELFNREYLSIENILDDVDNLLNKDIDNKIIDVYNLIKVSYKA